MYRPATVPLQRTWGWKIAAYLFGAGTGAGSYSVGAFCRLLTDLPRTAGNFAMALGIALAVLAVPFLIWDLGRPERFLRVLRARRSWLSRGAWILTAFCLVGVLSGLPPGEAPPLLALGLALSILVAIYTGLLLGTMLARPLWNSAVLPTLFLLSALSTGIAAVALVGAVTPWYGQVSVLTGACRAWHLGLLGGEALLLYFWLSLACGRTRATVARVVRGALATRFWGMVVAIGLALPILLELVPGAGWAGRMLAQAAVLAGGYSLRRLILLAGSRGAIDSLGTTFIIRPET